MEFEDIEMSKMGLSPAFFKGPALGCFTQLILIAFVAFFCAKPLQAAVLPPSVTSVTLSWDPSPSPAIAGYKLYVGTESGNYDQVLSAGLGTTCVVPNLIKGVTYYFSATAVDNQGLESDFSAELVYSIPMYSAPRVALSMESSQVVLTASGTPGAWVTVEASEDMQNWAAVVDIITGPDGQFRYSEPVSEASASRFYRLQTWGF